MENITMEDITKEAKDNKVNDSSPSSIADAFLTHTEDSSSNEELFPLLFLPDFDASTEAPTMRTSTPPPSVMNGSFVPGTPKPGAFSAHMGRSLALSTEAMSLSDSIGTFSVTPVPSNSSVDLRSIFSAKTSPLYPSSICQDSPATTLSSLQNTPSTLPSPNNTPTLQQIRSNGTMPSSPRTLLDTKCHRYIRCPLRRRGQIFKSLPSDLDTSYPKMHFSMRTPTEKVLLLDQEQISEWDIVVNPNGHVDDINDGSRRFLQLVKVMATPYSEQYSEKKFKTSLSMAIVEFVCAYGGRFVDMDDSGRYTLLSKAMAREKTSQALREMKASMWTKVEGTDLWEVTNVTPTPTMSKDPIHIDGKPGKWDVIGGRGGGGNHHEGNRRYRGLIEQFKVPYNYEGEEFHYVRMGKRKKLLISAIVDYVKSNGGQFVEISNHRGSTFEVRQDGIFFMPLCDTFKVEDGRLVEEGQLVEDDRFVKNRNYINWDGDFAFDVSEVVKAEVVHAFTNEK
jgi:hypothetical protein